MKLCRLPLVAIALALVSAAIHLGSGVAETLQFDRTAVASGEWWRLFTAHYTHFDANHLVWDVAALLVLGTLAERESRGRMVVALVVASLAISLAVWRWQPQFEFYRGLSGLDSALFGLVAAGFLRHPRGSMKILGALAIAGFGGKAAYEYATADALFASAANYAPAPLAHLVGLIVGGVVGPSSTGSGR